MSVLCNANATDFIVGVDWCLRKRTPNYLVICYNKTIIHDRGLWQVENALDASLPVFIMQMVCILVVNRLLMFAFKPLGLPRISAEMLVR